MADSLITLENVELDDLPLLMLKLIRLIGFSAAIKLVALRPGIPTFIPTVMQPDHWLAQELGIFAASALVKNWPGATIVPPNCKMALIKLRHRQVLRSRAQGFSQTECAMLYGLTPRQIRNIESNLPEDDLNGSLL